MDHRRPWQRPLLLTWSWWLQEAEAGDQFPRSVSRPAPGAILTAAAHWALGSGECGLA